MRLRQIWRRDADLEGSCSPIWISKKRSSANACPPKRRGMRLGARLVTRLGFASSLLHFGVGACLQRSMVWRSDLQPAPERYA
jgi:hypothetical protein